RENVGSYQYSAFRQSGGLNLGSGRIIIVRRKLLNDISPVSFGGAVNFIYAGQLGIGKFFLKVTRGCHIFAEYHDLVLFENGISLKQFNQSLELVVIGGLKLLQFLE